MSPTLNYAQEKELYRLLEFESRSCARNGTMMGHCAFPLRSFDELQRELIEKGILATRQDPARGPVVVITSEGYSYFPELDRQEELEHRRRAHERRLVVLTALFCILALAVGFLLGFMLH